MTNIKKIFILGISFVFISILLIVVVFKTLGFIEKRTQTDNFEEINIYYYDEVNNYLAYEEKNISKNSPDFIRTVFETMRQPAKSLYYKTIIPDNLQILGYSLESEFLDINFSNEYNYLSEMDKLFFRAGFVWTITELDYIQNVKIFIDGKELEKFDNNDMGYLSRENIILSPDMSSSYTLENFILYFTDEKGLKLFSETRDIEIDKNKNVEIQIIEQLILGPTTNIYYKTLPKETKIISLKTENRICYIDLSSDFFSNVDIVGMYSIVNSLTGLETIDKVQFLVEGEKISNKEGNIDLGSPLIKNKDIISQQ